MQNNTNELTVAEARDEWERKRDALLAHIRAIADAAQRKQLIEAFEAHNAKIKKLPISDLLTNLTTEQAAFNSKVRELIPVINPFDEILSGEQPALLQMQNAQMQYAQILQEAFRKPAKDYVARNMEEAAAPDADLDEMIGGVDVAPPAAARPNLALQLFNGEIRQLRNKTTAKISRCLGAYQLQPLTALNAQRTNAEEDVIYVDTAARTYSVLVAENNLQTGSLPADVVIPAANPLQDPTFKANVVKTAVANKHAVPQKILSQDPKDFAALVAAAGKETIHITNLPSKQPNLIIATMRELLLRGIAPTVDEDRLVHQLRTLSTFEKNEYQKLLAISACMKKAREAESNRHFDDHAQTLFAKTLLAAETHPDIPDENIETIQKAIVTLYASTHEGRRRMLNALSEIPSHNGITAEAFILKLLPIGDDRNDFKDLIAKNKQQQSADVIEQDILRRIAQFQANENDGINIFDGLLDDYKKNKAVLSGIINKLTVEERLTLLSRLHSSFIERYARGNFEGQIKKNTFFKFFRGEIYIATPLSKEIAFLLPELLLDANAEQTARLTSQLRSTAFEKLHDRVTTSEAEKRWHRYLAEESLANSFENLSTDKRDQIFNEILRKIVVASAAGEHAEYFVKNVAGPAREYILKNKISELRQSIPTIETDIINEYIAMYEQNPHETGLSYIKKGIALVLKNMSAENREALVNALGLNKVALTDLDETVLGILAENGITNASPSKIFAEKVFQNPDDLQSKFQQRIAYLASKPDEQKKFVQNVINDDMKQIVLHRDFNIAKFIAAINLIETRGVKQREVLKQLVHALDKHCPEKTIIDHINNQIMPANALLADDNRDEMAGYLEQLIKFYSTAHELAPDANKNLITKKFKDVMLQICQNDDSRVLLSELIRSKKLVPARSSSALEDSEEEIEEESEDENLQTEFLNIAEEATVSERKNRSRGHGSDTL